jgi:hypothetical protein
VRGLAVDGAADRLGGTEDLLDTTGEVLGERLVSHLAGNLMRVSVFIPRRRHTTYVVDLVERNVTGVLDVLLLLAVPWGLCDSQRGSEAR